MSYKSTFSNYCLGFRHSQLSFCRPVKTHLFYRYMTLAGFESILFREPNPAAECYILNRINGQSTARVVTAQK